MIGIIRRYTRWLHTQWPAGVVEKLPVVAGDGTTNVPGLYITGDLTGIPLLKFSAHGGTRAVRHICADPAFVRARKDEQARRDGILDLVIVGAGVSGMAAALEAEKQGLNYRVYEAAEPFTTIANFPKAKPIYTYPTDMTPDGDLQFHAEVKEPLLEELLEQTRHIRPIREHVEQVVRRGRVLEVVLPTDENLLAHRVIIAIGRSGNFRKLGVPGENLGKVFNRLHDPKDFCDKEALVVGGGDSAIETAVALASCGCRVTLSYRKHEFSRPKPENVERLQALLHDPLAEVGIEEPVSERVTTSTGGFMHEFKRAGHITLMMGSRVREIREADVVIENDEGRDVTLPNDAVFSMIGREAPLDFFRRSGVKLRGETYGVEWLAIAAFFLLIFAIYDWKNDGFVSRQIPLLARSDVFPANMPAVIAGWGEAWSAKVADRSTLIGTLAVSMKSRSFYYTLVYTLCILVFGILRVRRRKTPYVRVQTATLFLIQFIPLFLLPELILPLMGYNGLFDAGVGRTIADNLFERYISEQSYLAQNWPDWGHPRAYWRAYGLILAWPLMVYNVFTPEPIWGWLAISVIQTFVFIPAIIYFWGKGAYCGWICSCGGLAETMGDTLRDKMPHGPSGTA
jgi:NosR/NirI family transcriptional regulator, nitrous oxide reductase regulator